MKKIVLVALVLMAMLPSVVGAGISAEGGADVSTSLPMGGWFPSLVPMAINAQCQGLHWAEFLQFPFQGL